MAMCSYQALARYDDDCSRKYRARNLDDIRVTHREALTRSRLQLKCLKMLQNRRTLADVVFNPVFVDHYDDDHDEHDDKNATGDTDGQQHLADDSSSWLSSPMNDNTLTGEFGSPWSEEDGEASRMSSASASSDWPSSDDDADSHYEPKRLESLSDLPESFLEELSASSPPSSQCRRKQRNKQRHFSLYKQTNSPSPSSSPKSFCDSVKILQDFDNLMNLIKQCPTTAQNFSHVLGNSWQTLLNAIQDPSTGLAAIDLMNSVCNRNLMTPETLVTLFQHGLHLRLRNAIFALHDGAVHVCGLLNTIINSEPAIIPYLVEVMVSSKLSTELLERITCGSDNESKAIIDFYHQLTEATVAHRENPLQPLIPQVLVSTGVSQQTLHSYGPNPTLEKFFTSELIKSITRKCLDRCFLRETCHLNRALELLAHVLKLAYMSDSEPWVIKTLCCLRDLKIEDKMNSVIKGLQRLARIALSSEHRSQGVNHDQASQMAQVCTQFLQFYQQYYNYLVQGFGAQLPAFDTPAASTSSNSSASSSTTTSEADSWD